jgi:hypothetical protein
MGWVRRFREYIGDQRLDRLTDETVKGFFQQVGGKDNRKCAASIIGQFLRFAAPRELVVVTNERGPEGRASVPVKDDSFACVRQGWSIDKLKQQKDADEDLIAKLGRRVIDHYLYFQSRLEGGPENLDELNRLAADCREIIQTNLPLFMSLSAQGRNVHSAIDERIQDDRRGLDQEVRGLFSDRQKPLDAHRCQLHPRCSPPA